MFSSLITFLFPTFRKKEQPNYHYFEDSEKSAQEMHDTAVTDLQNPLTSKHVDIVSVEEQHQKSFYDYLFGQSPPTEQHDELSLYVSNKVEQLLQKPKHILEALPILSASLTQVMEQLNDKEFNTDALIVLIQREPVIAAKVIELANSSFYNRQEKEVTDLKSAFMLLGTH